MQTRELWHVNVAVTDLERSLAFYRHFGLEEIPRGGTPESEGAWLRFPDGRELHLSVGTAPAASRAHFAVIVDDLTQARSSLASTQASIEGARPVPGFDRFFVRDPDGNRIEVAQRV